VDFSAPSLDFSFPVGTGTTACIDVTIIDDDDLEGNHRFRVDFGRIRLNPALGRGVGSPSSTTVTIQDPEGMFSIPSRISQQSSSTMLFCNMVGW